MTNFQILLVVILASILADQGAGAIEDLGTLLKCEIKVSWLVDMKSDYGHCTRRVVMRIPSSLSDIITYPCPESAKPDFFQNAEITIVDSLIYIDSDTPSKVFKVLGDECEVTDYKLDGSTDTTKNTLSEDKCKDIKIALNKKITLKAVEASKEPENILSVLWDLIQIILTKLSSSS